MEEVKLFWQNTVFQLVGMAPAKGYTSDLCLFLFLFGRAPFIAAMFLWDQCFFVNQCHFFSVWLRWGIVMFHSACGLEALQITLIVNIEIYACTYYLIGCRCPIIIIYVRWASYNPFLLYGRFVALALVIHCLGANILSLIINF